MKQKLQKIFLISLITLLSSGMATHSAHADSIAVTDNGSGSTSQVTANSKTQTTIQSSNASNTTNSITTTSDTGSNNASANTGGNTSVTSGNTSTTVTVANAGNTSSVDTNNCNCQGHQSTTAISENGSGSTNTANQSSLANGSVSVTNTSTITNTIHGTATTGNNSASGNTGNTAITTGNISVDQRIMNTGNVSHVSGGFDVTDESIVKISNNGAGSINTVNNYSSHAADVAVTNTANLVNDIVWNLNTGGNTATANNGNVIIATGNINFIAQVLNSVNYSNVTVDCGCHNQTPPPTPQPQPTPAPGTPSTPSTPPGAGGGGGTTATGIGGFSGPGQVLGAAVGSLLPATGANWLFIALIGNIAMLFIGLVLRLRSGRSPGAAVAFAL